MAVFIVRSENSHIHKQSQETEEQSVTLIFCDASISLQSIWDWNKTNERVKNRYMKQ
jgi:hypothetical protein